MIYPMSMINSPQNERIKLVRMLQRQPKTRRETRRLVLEGVRLVADAFDAGARPDFVLHTADLGTPAHDLLARLADAGVTCLSVPEALMRDMADTEAPQGVLGVFPWPDLPVPTGPELVLVADGWRDPGNLGTALRTAAAAGVSVVVLPPGTVDPFNPKTLRAGMGAQFRVPILSLDWPDVFQRFAGLPVYVADAGGSVLYDAVDWTHPALLVVGSEAHGPHAAIRAVPHTTIAIPMVPGAESLNAAVAASLLVMAARRHALPQA